ncbi:MAG: AraC family transcriptional regulator [Planctomycetota bacterium]|jgi:AraC family transcriptional regulator
MRSDTQRDYRQRLLRVLVHVQKHLDDPLPLEELARVANFSAYHFHRIFRGMVGESVKEHVRRLRLERAAMRLTTSDRSVTAIAIDAGYETHEAFSRAFRRMFGQSPTEFRRRHRDGRGPEVISHEVDPAEAARRTITLVFSGDVQVEVRIETFEPMRVAFVRHVGPYDQCGAAWGQICQFAGQMGWFSPDVLRIGICHDDPDVTPPEKVRYDACLTVRGEFSPADPVGVQEIAGGEYAVVTHKGPYADVKQTYDRLFREWVPNSGRELRSDPCLEIYRNDPNEVAPEELSTDVCVPLAS